MRHGGLIVKLLAAMSASTASAAGAPTDVSGARLRADVEKLVSFGTRHTLSSETDPVRGIGAARRWAEAQFRQTASACGGCLDVVLPDRTVSGDRIPIPTHIVDVVAIQRGTQRPNEVVIVQGHIDSRVSDAMNARSDAPGANDDGSGSALVLEAARILSRRRFPGTIVYALLQGEEQGLYGGKLLADYARAQGWTVKAVLNNDIVGNTRGSDGMVVSNYVRVFSEGPRADGDDSLRAAARRFGGENDSPSRNLSRFVAAVASRARGGIGTLQVWRADRMGRGGDHLPFQELGYPAIRFTVGVENYDHQHQDLRTEKGVTYGDTVAFMDFAYLARVTRLNIATLAALADAPMPPEASVEAAVSTSARISWKPVSGAVAYRVWRRRTDARDWSSPVRVNGATALDMRGVRGDDWFFGVSAIGGNGAESPVSSALPGGRPTPLK